MSEAQLQDLDIRNFTMTCTQNYITALNDRRLSPALIKKQR